MKKSKPRILFALLNWGLGHVTRSIPIIKYLQQQDVELFLASDGRAQILLEKEFHELTCLTLPGYEVEYPKNRQFAGKIILQVPKILKSIKDEKKQVAAWQSSYNFDAIISDNRFGCIHEQCTNVFITHQLFIKVPSPFGFLEFPLEKLNHKYISNYDYCWVPDVPAPYNFSGRLSGKKKFDAIPIRFLGACSRLKKDASIPKKYDIAAILSGPEPQRSILEARLTKQLLELPGKHCIVRGVTETDEQKLGVRLDVFDHLYGNNINRLFNKSELIIARSGYSTILDLAALNKKAILIPTPGQTEQEYLAENFMEKGICLAVDQASIKLKKDLEKAKSYSGFEAFEAYEGIPLAVDELLNKIGT